MQNKNKKIFDVKLLQRVFSYAAPYKYRFWGSVVLAVLLAVVAPVRPYLIQETINNYVVRGVEASETGAKDALISLIVWITVIQIGILLLESAMRFFFSFMTSWLGQTVVRDLRVKVFNKVLHLNLKQYDQTPIGTLTTRTINDIESINEVFSDGLIPIIADLLSIFAILGFMFYSDWQLTLICLAPFPFLIIATYYFKESVNKSFIRVRNAIAQLNAYVQEHIAGMPIVQGFAIEKQEMNKFVKINEEHRNANIKAIFAYSVFFPVVEIILAVSTSLLVWWVAKTNVGLNAADANLLIGKLISFYLCLNLLFRPLRVIADKFNVLQMGMIASERVFKVLDNPDVTKNEGTFRPESIKGSIEFKNVDFAYVEDRNVLKNINFKVEQGETVAIVGHTGSGKTSIISLLNRLYSIQKGEILIDGVNIDEYDIEVLRKNIGVVLQDVFLFSGSVHDNITLRNPNITEEQVKSAAKMIDLHEFIEQLPGGYHFDVKERGATLSLGQRQLLSFIRALLFNPSVLILDEATSSVDTETEQLIQHAIDKLISGRTSIIIAHRLSTIRKANKIIVLDKGEIVEIGNHEELMNQRGSYHKLHEMQFQQLSH